MAFVIIILFISFILFFYFRYRHITCGNLTLISGGVKTGKTQLCVDLALRKYKSKLRQYKFKLIISKIFHKPFPEKPLLYSNMPLSIPYCPLTLDLISGKKRFAYNSIIICNEQSLIAGSKDIKNEELNDWLLRFYKLIAHETRGGYMYLDTQSPQDMHYTLKRSLSTYIYIMRNIKLPFFSILKYRNLILMDGENSVASPIDDGDLNSHIIIIPNRVWRYYDRYAYSILTDDLDVESDLDINTKNLKIRRLIRCKDIKNIQKHS